MKVLVIGSGGREHALSWKLSLSPKVSQVFVATGNPGTQNEEKIININISPENITKLVDFAKKENIHLTVVGPEQPLVNGIVDIFENNNLLILGPSEYASQLEGSKGFAKDFLKKYKIPTASYEKFTEIEPAINYVNQNGVPIVIKADGLAAGKGVIVAETIESAHNAIQDMLSDNKFGDAGSSIVIEEFLDGEEASYIILSDGKTMIPMATSQDHKRVGDGDKGENTGGMGAYSPAPIVDELVNNKVLNEVIYPTLDALKSEGQPYKGFLYAGLMIMPDGSPKVIEFNCRFGDPETQPIMMRLESDFFDICYKAATGNLKNTEMKWSSKVGVGVVLASEGYPGAYKKDYPITIKEYTPGIKLFHAGTSLKNGKLVNSGGRVICVTALGNNLEEAREKVYSYINKNIFWDGMFYRKDIGFKALKKSS